MCENYVRDMTSWEHEAASVWSHNISQNGMLHADEIWRSEMKRYHKSNNTTGNRFVRFLVVFCRI